MSKQTIDISKKGAQIIQTNKTNVDFLLSLNVNNRNIKREHKNWLKRAVEEGKFMLTNQGVGVTKDGILIDGQHRLSAIREAGYPVCELVVVTGLDPEIRLYLDQNARRSVADVLKIVVGESVTPRAVAAIKFIMSLKTNASGDFDFDTRKQKLSLDAIKKTVEKREDIVDEIVAATAGVGRSGVVAALLSYAQKYDKFSALELARQVGTGEETEKGDSGYALRQMSLRQSSRKGSWTPTGGYSQLIDFRHAVFACIAHARREKIEALKQATNWGNLPTKKKKAA